MGALDYGSKLVHNDQPHGPRRALGMGSKLPMIDGSPDRSINYLLMTMVLSEGPVACSSTSAHKEPPTVMPSLPLEGNCAVAPASCGGA